MSNASQTGKEKKTLPRQKQKSQPGGQGEMTPTPESAPATYVGSGKLLDRAAIITGGDSGIGRAVAVLFAREGADVAVVYLNEDDDARETQRLVEAEGRRCLLLRGDIQRESFCRKAVETAAAKLGRLDVLVNNAGVQFPKDSLLEIEEKQIVETFRTNIIAMFFMARAALPHLKRRPGGAIINTTSVTAYRGSATLLDYASTKGAIVGFTRSLALSLAGEGVRVNGVAPGPIWTPLIPATFPKEKVETFGSKVPMGRPGQPSEVAPCYVFLASSDSSYMTGQILHPNGGEIING